MTEDEKKQIVADFQKAFDIVNLSQEILERVTTPAKPNQVYEATLTRFGQYVSRNGATYYKVSFVTKFKEEIEAVLFESEAYELAGALGFSSPKEATMNGSYRIYYQTATPKIVVLK